MEVTLLQNVKAPILRDGKPSGNMTVPKGSLIEVVKVNGNSLTVRFNALQFSIDSGITDYNQRAAQSTEMAAAKDKAAQEKQDAESKAKAISDKRYEVPEKIKMEKGDIGKLGRAAYCLKTKIKDPSGRGRPVDQGIEADTDFRCIQVIGPMDMLVLMKETSRGAWGEFPTTERRIWVTGISIENIADDSDINDKLQDVEVKCLGTKTYTNVLKAKTTVFAFCPVAALPKQSPPAVEPASTPATAAPAKPAASGNETPLTQVLGT